MRWWLLCTILFLGCSRRVEPKLVTLLAPLKGCIGLAPAVPSSLDLNRPCPEHVSREMAQLPDSTSAAQWQSRFHAGGIGAVIEPYNTSSTLFRAWRDDADMRLDLLWLSPRWQIFAAAPLAAHWPAGSEQVLRQSIVQSLLRGPEPQVLEQAFPFPKHRHGLWLGLWKDGELRCMGDAVEDNWAELLSGATEKLRDACYPVGKRAPTAQDLDTHILEVNFFHQLTWIEGLTTEQLNRSFVAGKDSFYLHQRSKDLAEKSKAHAFLLPRSAFLYHRERPQQILEDLCFNSRRPRSCHAQAGSQLDSFRTWTWLFQENQTQRLPPGSPFSKPLSLIP